MATQVTAQTHYDKIYPLTVDLVGRYGMQPDKASFVLSETFRNGYCPFIAGGVQYTTGTYKTRPGYFIRRDAS